MSNSKYTYILSLLSFESWFSQKFKKVSSNAHTGRFLWKIVTLWCQQLFKFDSFALSLKSLENENLLKWRLWKLDFLRLLANFGKLNFANSRLLFKMFTSFSNDPFPYKSPKFNVHVKFICCQNVYGKRRQKF